MCATAMNPKGRVASQEDGGQSQIPAYSHFLVLLGHLTDSECNQKLTSKKGSLIERKRSSGRVRRKGDEPQASGYHSEGKPLCITSLSNSLYQTCHTLDCGFYFLLRELSLLSQLWDLGIHEHFKHLYLFHSLVFRRNTEREAGS